MIYEVMLKDKVESTVIASRVGVDDLEEHLRQKIEMVWTYCPKR